MIRFCPELEFSFVVNLKKFFSCFLVTHNCSKIGQKVLFREVSPFKIITNNVHFSQSYFRSQKLLTWNKYKTGLNQWILLQPYFGTWIIVFNHNETKMNSTTFWSDQIGAEIFEFFIYLLKVFAKSLDLKKNL